jgi:hypothetical protein
MISPIDGNYYCEDHINVGPLEMKLRVQKRKRVRSETEQKKMRKLNEELLRESVLTQTVAVSAIATTAYNRGLQEVTSFMERSPNGLAQIITSSLNGPQPQPPPTSQLQMQI